MNNTLKLLVLLITCLPMTGFSGYWDWAAYSTTTISSPGEYGTHANVKIKHASGSSIRYAEITSKTSRQSSDPRYLETAYSRVHGAWWFWNHDYSIPLDAQDVIASSRCWTQSRWLVWRHNSSAVAGGLKGNHQELIIKRGVVNTVTVKAGSKLYITDARGNGRMKAYYVNGKRKRIVNKDDPTQAYYDIPSYVQIKDFDISNNPGTLKVKWQSHSGKWSPEYTITVVK